MSTLQIGILAYLTLGFMLILFCVEAGEGWDGLVAVNKIRGRGRIWSWFAAVAAVVIAIVLWLPITAAALFVTLKYGPPRS